MVKIHLDGSLSEEEHKLTLRMEGDAKSMLADVWEVSKCTEDLLGVDDALAMQHKASDFGGLLTNAEYAALSPLYGQLQIQRAYVHQLHEKYRKLQKKHAERTMGALVKRELNEETPRHWWDETPWDWWVQHAPGMKDEHAQLNMQMQAEIDKLTRMMNEYIAVDAALGRRFFRDRVVGFDHARNAIKNLNRACCEDVMSTSPPGLVERLVCVLDAEWRRDDMDALLRDLEAKEEALKQRLHALEMAEVRHLRGDTAKSVAVAPDVAHTKLGAEEVLERVMNAEDDLGILGISSVDKAEIERAVKHTLQRIHPDKLPGDKRAQVATERVQRASERLLAGSTMAPAMTSRLKRKHEEARLETELAMQNVWDNVDLDKLTPEQRAHIHSVIAIKRMGDRGDAPHVECTVMDPAGHEPLTLALPCGPAFASDRLLTSHKARQELVFPKYARIVRDFLKTDSNARKRIKAEATLKHCWATEEGGEDDGEGDAMDKWLAAVERTDQ